MSYDVTIELDVCPHCDKGAERVFDCNYTSNMSPAWRAAGVNLREFHNATARELLPKLRDAIARIDAEPEKYRAYEPSNGWGHVSTMMDNFLRPLLKACEKYPDGIVRVSV